VILKINVPFSYQGKRFEKYSLFSFSTIFAPIFYRNFEAT